MIAEFYIIVESFAYNPNLSIAVIEEKIKALANDLKYIKKYSETNKLFVHPEIYNIYFLKDVLLSDLLYNNMGRIDRDVYNALQKIAIESATTTHSTQEVIEVLLPEHDENFCHGLIAFNAVDGINPEFQIVYGLQNWFNFRRHYLGLYPKNASFFIDECQTYFPNLFFHEHNKQTVAHLLHNCSKKIVFHLAALNDQFKTCILPNLNRTQILERFSIMSGLDETASLEGNAAKKPLLTFQFKNKDNEMVDVCCEPHLKLCYNDNYPGDSSYSNNRRIYFHEGIASIKKGNILIGHIGEHL